MSSKPSQLTLTSRHRAILMAVGAGSGEVLCGCGHDLLIDGRFCDHLATHELFRAGLIVAADPGSPGRRVAARVTESGRQVLAAVRRRSRGRQVEPPVLAATGGS